MWKNVGKRQNVGFSIWEQPWTGQAGIELKGLRRQEGFPNFLWDVINQRHVREVKAQKLSVGDPLSRDVLTDVREGMAHQKAGGNVTMKCRSLVYWHNGDRALTGEDHMLCNGWNLDELDLDCVAEPLPNDLKDAWDEHLGLERSTKRRKPQRRSLDVCLREGSGAGMTLYDVGLAQYLSLLAIECPEVWESPPSDMRFDITSSEELVRKTLVDPNETSGLQAFIREEEGDDNPSGHDGDTD